jgi:hypothetical protein
MFFILFVNDYPRCLKYSNVTIYADDTSQDVTDKSVDIIETKLMWSQKQYELDEWKQINNELEKNTVYMLVGTKQRLSKCRKIYNLNWKCYIRNCRST